MKQRKVVDLRLERELRRGWLDNHGRTWVLVRPIDEQEYERFRGDVVAYRRAFGAHCIASKNIGGGCYLWKLKYADEQPRFDEHGVDHGTDVGAGKGKAS